MRQLIALLVLTIVAAASGLPHCHPSAPADPVPSDTSTRASASTTAYSQPDSIADLLECVACILQRILSHVSTEPAEAAPRPLPQAEVEAASVQPVSSPFFRFTDPRGPPNA